MVGVTVLTTITVVQLAGSATQANSAAGAFWCRASPAFTPCTPLFQHSNKQQELADAGMVLRDPSTFHLILHHVRKAVAQALWVVFQ